VDKQARLLEFGEEVPSSSVLQITPWQGRKGCAFLSEVVPDGTVK